MCLLDVAPEKVTVPIPSNCRATSAHPYASACERRVRVGGHPLTAVRGPKRVAMRPEGTRDRPISVAYFTGLSVRRCSRTLRPSHASTNKVGQRLLARKLQWSPRLDGDPRQ